MIDRRRVFKSLALAPNQDLIKKVQEGDFQALQSWLKEHPGVLSRCLDPILTTNIASVELADRRVSASFRDEKLGLEKGLTVLATLGANAPFIGLFGTVLGIIRAFASLGSQAGSQAVMSGVAQALYATALGLLVAIPAVVAFNIFTRRLREVASVVESLKDFILSNSNIE